MQVIKYSLLGIFLSCSLQTVAAESTDQNDLTNTLERIDKLEQQIKIIEENLPRLIRKSPLDQPNITNNGAIQETMTRLYDMFKLDFVSYQDQINTNRQYCNLKGFQDYTTFLKQSTWLESIKKNKMLLYIHPESFPKIIKEGPQDKKYTWVIEFPLIATLENINTKQEKPFKAIVSIERGSELSHPMGIVISSVQFE